MIGLSADPIEIDGIRVGIFYSVLGEKYLSGSQEELLGNKLMSMILQRLSR